MRCRRGDSANGPGIDLWWSSDGLAVTTVANSINAAHAASSYEALKPVLFARVVLEIIEVWADARHAEGSA